MVKERGGWSGTTAVAAAVEDGVVEDCVVEECSLTDFSPASFSPKESPSLFSSLFLPLFVFTPDLMALALDLSAFISAMKSIADILAVDEGAGRMLWRLNRVGASMKGPPARLPRHSGATRRQRIALQNRKILEKI